MKTWLIIIILSLILISGCGKTSDVCISNEPSTLEEYKSEIETWELRGNKANCELGAELLTRGQNILFCRFGQIAKISVIPTSLGLLEGSCESGIKYEHGRPDIKVVHKKTVKGQKIFESVSDDPYPHEGWTWCSKDEKFIIGTEMDNGIIQKYFDKFYKC